MNVRVVKNVMNEKNVKNDNNDRNVTNDQNVKNVNHASLKTQRGTPGIIRECLSLKRRRRPTLPHCGAVPSARPGLTSLFGMGRGGTPGLKPPDYVVALATGQTACRLTCGNRRDSSRHGSLRASSAATACASRAKLTGY